MDENNTSNTKKKGGRPIDPNKIKKKPTVIRLSDAELSKIKIAAEKIGLKPSQYIKMATFKLIESE